MARLARTYVIYMYSLITSFVNKDNPKDNSFVAFGTGCHCSTFVVLQEFKLAVIYTAFVFFVSDNIRYLRCYMRTL